MMGRQRGDQTCFFYEFRLDERIPKNHLLRRINGYVTAALADVHQQLAPYYSEIGRPSVDPDRKSTRLNSSHLGISYAVFCLKKKKKKIRNIYSRSYRVERLRLE